MTVTTRPYAAEDCAACWAVFHRAVQIGAANHYDQAQRDAWSPHQPGPTPESCRRLSTAHTIVAETEGALIGFMSLTPNGHLDLAFVAPEWIGRGVARALHTDMLRCARDQGMRRLTVDASHLARRFLARQGWRLIASETVTRNGIDLPRFRMDLPLETAP